MLMESRRFKKAIKKIAATYGVSTKEVRRDIRFAIAIAENNPDPKKIAQIRSRIADEKRKIKNEKKGENGNGIQ